MAAGRRAAVIARGGFAWQNGRESDTRYVSPLLPDGTCYTFLYPARMKNVGLPQWEYAVISGHKAPSPMERISALLSRRSAAPPFINSLIAVSIRAPDADEKPVSHHETPFPAEYDVWLYQAKQRRLFVLMHNAQFTPVKQFKREAKVVGYSFRLLAPGAPIPPL